MNRRETRVRYTPDHAVTQDKARLQCFLNSHATGETTHADFFEDVGDEVQEAVQFVTLAGAQLRQAARDLDVAVGHGWNRHTNTHRGLAGSGLAAH